MGETAFTLPVYCSPDTIQDPTLPPALFRCLLSQLRASATLPKRLWNQLRRLATYDDLHVITQAHRLPEAQGLRALRQVLTPGLLLRLTEEPGSGDRAASAPGGARP